MPSDTRDGVGRLPGLDALLARHDAREAAGRLGEGPLARALRERLDAARTRLDRGGPQPRADELVAEAVEALDAHRGRRLARVVNATGVVLHPRLGRAPLSGAARAAVAQAAGYTTVEYDLDTGGRRPRGAHAGELLAEACGAEAGAVVSGEGAALAVAVAALAGGREVLVSRGELVDVAGAYRVPDALAASGAPVREVGAANATSLADYKRALSADTGLILRAQHGGPTGTADGVDLEALVAIGREHGVPVVLALGSGLLSAPAALDEPAAADASGPATTGPGSALRRAMAGQPTVTGAIALGADLVVASADALLGGPQAGLLAGRGDLVLRCAQHPLARVTAADRLQLAALEATLEAQLAEPSPRSVPTVAMLATDPEALRERAGWLASQIGEDAEVVPTRSPVGSGVAGSLESAAVAVASRSPERLADRLHRTDPPVVARIDEGRVLLDLRTVPPAQDGELLDLVLEALGH